MATFTFKLPDIGEGITEAEIATWRVAVGDTVKEDQPLVDVLTEKAAVEIPSPMPGKVIELRGEPGDMAAVGGPLVVLEVAGEAESPEGGKRQTAGAEAPRAAAAPKAPEPPAAPQPAAPAPSPPPATATAAARVSPLVPRAEGERPLASPAVRQRARDLGIQLSYVPGSGPAGRITHADLDAFVARRPLSGGGAVNARAKREGVEQIKIIGLRRKIAEAMQRSKQRIPHFAYVEEVDVTELEALRNHLNDNRKPDQAKLTLLPFLVRALVKAVPEHPEVNGTFDDEAGVVYRPAALHVGIAAQTPNGLVVPVVRHAETLDLWQCAAEIKRLAEAARAGKATREELSGSSITISSLGPMGGIVSTPVINAPEVAIVGVNKMIERPMVRNGQVVIRTMMNLSSSFDHRIVDGWNAAEFIQHLKRLFENPATLFMGEG
ncbi:MAG TPA: dihydrolipoamide acetyltransferase family protein [Nevskia sp.]|nr:dihydrolipoamide acetyltransferase family protein [Nevskia sp.]